MLQGDDPQTLENPNLERDEGASGGPRHVATALTGPHAPESTRGIFQMKPPWAERTTFKPAAVSKAEEP